MKFDTTKINQLTNGSQEALIYGFSSCHIETIANTLSEQGFNAYTCSNFPFLRVNSDELCGYHCKKFITILIQENYKRQQKGESIIPLIFVVGYDGHESIQLNINKVASSHKDGKFDSIASVTEKELRRCYKIYAESNDAMRKLAEETFKFVIFKVTEKKNSNPATCELLPIPPFWNNPEWKGLWQNRTRQNALRDHSIWNKKWDDNWRAQLNKIVSNEETRAPRNGLCNLI